MCLSLVLYTYISELPVCDAHMFVVDLKCGIRDHVFMCNSVNVYLNCLSAMPKTLLFNLSLG